MAKQTTYEAEEWGVCRGKRSLGDAQGGPQERLA